MDIFHSDNSSIMASVLLPKISHQNILEVMVLKNNKKGARGYRHFLEKADLVHISNSICIIICCPTYFIYLVHCLTHRIQIGL